LKQRQQQQQALSEKMGAVSDEKQQLTAQIDDEVAKRQRLEQMIAEVNSDIGKKEKALTHAEGEMAKLNKELLDTRKKQKVLSGEIEILNQRRKNDSEQFAQLKDLLEQELSNSRVEISQLKNRMTVINLTSGILFTTGSADIRPAGQKVLSLIATSLNAYPDRAVSVEGHTDAVPVGDDSDFSSNWELSSARALAAVKYFQYTKGVDPKRLKVVGFGEHQPISSNKTPKERELNRRIEIRILPPASATIMKDAPVSSEAKS